MISISRKVNEDKMEMAKCPDCGTEYPVQTGYCVKCQKKVDEPVSKDEKKEAEEPKTDDEKKDVEVCPDCGKEPCECDDKENEYEPIIVDIVEETKLPGTDIVLEAGDKIEVVKEANPKFIQFMLYDKDFYDTVANWFFDNDINNLTEREFMELSAAFVKAFYRG